MGAGLLGHVAIAGGLLAACTAAVLSLTGSRGRPELERWGYVALAATAGCCVLATAALGWALVRSDLSLVYVADHSRRGASAPYRLAGLWGGMAGSLLLWVSVLSLVGWAAARSLRRSTRASAAVPTGPSQAVLAGLSAAFLVVLATLADPFRRLAVPALDGSGLTPILEHPAMLYHPPLLYTGLALLAAPFAHTIAALLAGRTDLAWAAISRRPAPRSPAPR